MAQRKTPQEAPLTVRITSAEKEALSQVAAAKGLSRNAFVRQVLNAQLPKEQRHQSA
jgi:predicted HicB family RNase H-like nuclease